MREESGVSPAAAEERLAQPIRLETAGNYFVSTYPPFSTWSEAEIDPALEALESRSREPLGIYIHVPYCAKKCEYCYYLSYAGRERAEIEAYVGLLAREIEFWRRKPGLCDRPCAFVYFGGGTPSILSPEAFRLLRDLTSWLEPWERIPEITVECAPRTVGPRLAAAFASLGVTRVSLGIQSFRDRVLLESGRVHLEADALRAYGELRGAGRFWINIDLIAGLPIESPDDWRYSVRRALEMAPDGITLYALEIPFNTRLYRRLEEDTARGALPSWSEKRERIAWAFEECERAGYAVASAYNLVREAGPRGLAYQRHVWGGGDMLGLGLSSYSYVGGVHFQNHVQPERYRRSVLEARPPLLRAKRVTPEERAVRECVLELKWGRVCGARFKKRHGTSLEEAFPEAIGVLRAEGLAWLEDGDLVLTRQGLLRVDELSRLFFLPHHRSIRYT